MVLNTLPTPSAFVSRLRADTLPLDTHSRVLSSRITNIAWKGKCSLLTVALSSLTPLRDSLLSHLQVSQRWAWKRPPIRAWFTARKASSSLSNRGSVRVSAGRYRVWRVSERGNRVSQEAGVRSGAFESRIFYQEKRSPWWIS